MYGGIDHHFRQFATPEYCNLTGAPGPWRPVYPLVYSSPDRASRFILYQLQLGLAIPIRPQPIPQSTNRRQMTLGVTGDQIQGPMKKKGDESTCDVVNPGVREDNAESKNSGAKWCRHSASQ